MEPLKGDLTGNQHLRTIFAAWGEQFSVIMGENYRFAPPKELEKAAAGFLKNASWDSEETILFISGLNVRETHPNLMESLKIQFEAAGDWQTHWLVFTTQRILFATRKYGLANSPMLFTLPGEWGFIKPLGGVGQFQRRMIVGPVFRSDVFESVDNLDGLMVALNVVTQEGFPAGPVVKAIWPTTPLSGPQNRERRQLDEPPFHLVFLLSLLEAFMTVVQDVLPPTEPNALQEKGSPPAPRLLSSPRDAELIAQEWMIHWGYEDARCTPVGADAGVDVDSSRAIAQVKAEMSPTGRPVIQQTYGAAVLHSKQALVFSLAGFTKEAIAWADQAGVALFSFDLQGVPKSENEHGSRVASQM